MNPRLLSTLALLLGRSDKALTALAVSGGCIHQCWCVQDAAGQRWFVKSGSPDRDAMFASEAYALQQLAACAALVIPEVLAQGCDETQAYLLLEWLDLLPDGDERRLGSALAQLHRCSGAHFGWAHDNYIGLTRQANPVTDDWAAFWQQRVAYQLQLAEPALGAGAVGARVLAAIPLLLTHQPPPSLLHGDLWRGNVGFLADGRPVLFDPASHFGDRECELALADLFGGFGSDFYAGYHAAWPLPEGYESRRPLYQLYHVLNHFNLFGGGYAAQAKRLMREVLEP